MSGPLEIAHEAWGTEIPDWVELLANECVKSNQSAVAKRLNRSAALVSTVLRNKYQGNMEAVEDIVRGVFERATVICPALGEIGTNTCRNWQANAQKYTNVNSEYVRMYRACHRCKRFKRAAA